MTNRCAVLVDAGYLWAGVGDLLFEGAARSDIYCHYDTLVAELAKRARAESGRELLRILWYDGAVNKLPTKEQLRVGVEPNVKLRLGRVVGGRQKGVDSLIVLDLLRLGRAENVDTLFLLGGDDDLTEGVREAQFAGSRAIVWGIRDEAPSVSQQLVLEADAVEEIGAEFWQPHFETRDDRTPAATYRDDSWYFRQGEAFGKSWAKSASVEAVADGLRIRPRIRRKVDADLLRTVADGRALNQIEVVAAREGFWSALDGG